MKVNGTSMKDNEINEDYIIDIIYEPADSKDNKPDGRVEKENGLKEHSMMLPEQEAPVKSAIPSSDALNDTDAELESSLLESADEEKNPYWFPIVYPYQPEAGEKDGSDLTDLPLVKPQTRAEMAASEVNPADDHSEETQTESFGEMASVERREGADSKGDTLTELVAKRESSADHIVIPPRLPGEEEQAELIQGQDGTGIETDGADRKMLFSNEDDRMRKRQGDTSKQTESPHDGLKDILAGIEAEKSNRNRAGKPTEQYSGSEGDSGTDSDSSSYMEAEDPFEGFSDGWEDQEAELLEELEEDAPPDESPPKKSGNTEGQDQKKDKRLPSKEKGGNQHGRAAPSQILLVALTIVMLGLGGAFGYMYFFRTPKPEFTGTGYNNLTIDTAAAEEHETASPISSRNVYFAGIDNSTCNGDTIVYLENLPENDDFLMRYEIYTLTEDGQRKDMIHETDLIPSGKHVNWKPAEDLEVGVHHVAFVEQPFMQSGKDYIPLTAGENQVVLTIVE